VPSQGDALFVGLISGTSADGIDAALISVSPPLAAAVSSQQRNRTMAAPSRICA
jgi:1,6-anhydro-N-acetylmuramate kinase